MRKTEIVVGIGLTGLDVMIKNKLFQTMKNTFLIFIICGVLTSCIQEKTIQPNPNLRGITLANRFNDTLKNVEGIDTFSVSVRGVESLRISNVLPTFKEHYMYVNGNVIDLNNCTQYSISIHQKRIPEFKLFLEK